MAASCQANTSTIGSLIVLLLGMDRFMRVPLSCWLSRCMGRNWNIPVENFIAFGCREERRRRESILDYFVPKKAPLFSSALVLDQCDPCKSVVRIYASLIPSMNAFSLRERDGCRSLRSALASI